MKTFHLCRVVCTSLILLTLIGCGGDAPPSAAPKGPSLVPDSQSGPGTAKEARAPEPAKAEKLVGRWRRYSEATGMTSEGIRSLWMNSDCTQGWATGTGGMVLRYADGKWSLDEAASALTPYNLDALAMSEDGTEGWAGGGGNPHGFGKAVFIRYKDGAWQAYDKKQEGYVPQVDAIELSKDGKTGWAITMGGTILKLADGTWTENDESEERGLLAVSDDATAGWILGAKSSKRLKDGKWTKDESANGLTNSDVTSIWINADGTQGWAGVMNSESERREDMLQLVGGKWIKEPAGAWHSPNYCSVSAIAVNQAGTEGWAGRSDRGMLQLKDGNWIEAVPGKFFGFRGIRRIVLSDDGKRGCAVVGGTEFYHLEDGQWKLNAFPPRVTDRNLAALWMKVDGSAGWAAGDRVLLRFADGKWTAVETDVEFSDIWLNADGTQGWGVGDHGLVRFENNKWTRVEDPSTGVLRRIALSADGTSGWAIGCENAWRLADGKWKKDDETAAKVVKCAAGIWLSDAGDNGWIVGDGMVLHLKNGKWESDEAAGKMGGKAAGVDMTADGSQGWAANYGPALLRYSGGAWHEYEQTPYLSTDGDYLYAIAMGTDFKSGVVVGMRGIILRLAGTWQNDLGSKLVSADLRDVWLQADGSEGWAVGQRGEILRFDVNEKAGP